MVQTPSVCLSFAPSLPVTSIFSADICSKAYFLQMATSLAVWSDNVEKRTLHEAQLSIEKLGASPQKTYLNFV